MAQVVSKGLDNVLIGDSAISLVTGEAGGLAYRGYSIDELVGLPYESVVHLLLFASPPETDPSPTVTPALTRRRIPSREAVVVVDALPRALPAMDALRTLISTVGGGRFGYPPTLEEGYELIAVLPSLLARYARRQKGLAPVAPHPTLGHVANYLWMLSGELPPEKARRALEAYFVLVADHGMNASTFALRVAISTNADLAAAATAGLATLKGPLHGGAPSRVSDMLDAVAFPEAAANWVRQAVERKEVIYGFGHRAYKTDDPRAVLLKRVARADTESTRYHLAETLETEALRGLRAAHPGARIYTNVEYWSAVVLESVGLDRALFTPTFALARTVGWTAHALEQAGDNRLIRPDVRYTGPAVGLRWPRRRSWVPAA